MPVMDVAGGWYTSGTFWAGAGVVVAMLAAVAVVWVTLAVGFPRRRLYFGLRAAAPLLAAPAGMRGDLELRHHGTALANPRVVTVELVSRGRKDIPSEAYDDRQPLVLDVGGRIVEVLQVTSKPGILPSPQITPDGTSLKIGPSLIGRRQEITINVLTDGGEPSLTCHSSLIDVQVRRGTEGSSPLWPGWPGWPWWAALVVAGVAGAGAAEVKAGANAALAVALAVVGAVVGAALTMAGLAALTMAALAALTMAALAALTMAGLAALTMAALAAKDRR
jgi:hypothetical protein